MKTLLARKFGATAGAMAQARPATVVFDEINPGFTPLAAQSGESVCKKYRVWLQAPLNPAPSGDADAPNFSGCLGRDGVGPARQITKTKIQNMKKTISLILLNLTLGLAQVATAAGQPPTTAFTYQGKLTDNGSPANRSYNLTFRLYNDSTSINPLNLLSTYVPPNPVTAANGVFTTTLDFGNPPFTGQPLWLEIQLDSIPTGVLNPPVVLSPRTELTPTPYAIYAQTAGTVPNGAIGSSQLAANAVASANLQANSVTSDKIPNGEVVKTINNQKDDVYIIGGANVNVNTSDLDHTITISSTANSVFSLNGNNAYYNAGNVGIGTSNPQSTLDVAGTITADSITSHSGQPLQLQAGGSRALRLESAGHSNRDSLGHLYSALSSVNLIGGSSINSVASGVYGATIAGGGYEYWSLFSGSSISSNRVTGNFGTVSGGYRNTSGYLGTVAGGSGNNAGNYGTVAGGSDNIAGTSGTVSGGSANLAGSYGTVPGGANNNASGQYSLAAGAYASAFHDGTFVWNSSLANPLSSTAAGQFLIGAPGGVGIGTASPSNALEVHSSSDAEIGIQSDDTDGRLWTLQSSGTWGGALDHTFQIIDRTANLSRLIIYTNGMVSVGVLQITGGSDVAEPFNMPEITPKGAVVVIDEENPGHLKVSQHAYDTHVAGIVSGADGINPGLSLHQEGVLEGGKNVALSGRVKVMADASNGEIKPGDLLTTSDIAGHCMKVTDHGRAQGAIIGKAMSALEKGRGYLLVLVSLQ
jgi:hypothetical protein